MARMTGIPADTLRMWERRYGFPKPMRSPTRIRAYAQEDVERLQLISQALAQGHRPGQVVPLGRDELERIVELTASPLQPPVPAVPKPTAGSGPATLDAVVQALLAGDLLTTQRLIRQAVGTLGAKAFLTDFAYPLVVHVGELWADGTIDIRHEHLVTDALSTQVRVLLATYEDARATPSVLIAALPLEEHHLGGEMTALYLALEGALPRLLGTAAPVDQIVAASRELGVDVVGLTLIRRSEPGELDADIARLRSALPRKTELWIGGAAASTVLVEPPNTHRLDTWEAMATHVARLRRRS